MSKTITIQCMRRLSKKVLASVLALLVSLFPLQGVLASLVDSPDRLGTTHHEMSSHQGHDDAAGGEPMAADGDCCPATGCLDGSLCASAHCVSCTSAIVALSQLPDITLADSGFSAKHRKAARYSPSSLFRPPWS